MVTNVYRDSKYQDPLQVGLEYQDFVIDVLGRRNFPLQIYSSKRWQYNKGESPQRWEIKLDNRCVETGRLSIEIAEKTRANQIVWIQSGIYRTDSWFYVQGNYQRFFIFMTKHMRLLYESGRYQVYEKPTIKTFYISLDDARKFGEEIVPKQEDYQIAHPET